MDENTITSLVEPSQKPVFGFVLSLSNVGRQEAFEIAVSSFIGALRSFTSSPGGPDFLRALFKKAIERCRNFTAATGPDTSGDEMARLVKKALFSLSFEQKCLLLLRDQQHFSYEDMGAILGEPSKEVRSKVTSAREALRAQMESLLK